MAYLTRDLSETSSARNYEALKAVDRGIDELRRSAKRVTASFDEDDEDEAEVCAFLEELKKAMA